MKLSGLIIARNEETKIESCLKCLNFVDEIIIVLDRSEDNTEKIAKKYTKKIFKGSWFCEAERRNFGLHKCNSDWILEIDADEIVTKPLANEIIKKIKSEDCDYFYIPLVNYINSIEIKYGWMACLAPDGKFSLFTTCRASSSCYFLRVESCTSSLSSRVLRMGSFMARRRLLSNNNCNKHINHCCLRNMGYILFIRC